MKKMFLMAAVAVMTATTGAFAQGYRFGDVKPFEFEVGAGVAMGNRPSGTQVAPGAFFLIEGRYNVPGTPFDVGVQGYMGGYHRNNVAPVDGHRSGRYIMPRIVTLYGDYNFRQWRRVSLFGGAGLGYARVVNKHSGSGVGNTVRENFLAITPRVGAEFFHRVRLTFDCKLVSKYYSAFGVNVGFVLGGGARE